MADSDASFLQEMARQIASADAETFKIVIVSNAHEAGVVKNLLVRDGVGQNDIVELGYTASDDQNEMLLRGQKPIVIAPESIVKHRPCRFYPPAAASKAMVFEIAEGEAGSCEFRWNRIPFKIDELELDFGAMFE